MGQAGTVVSRRQAGFIAASIGLTGTVGGVAIALSNDVNSGLLAAAVLVELVTLVLGTIWLRHTVERDRAAARSGTGSRLSKRAAWNLALLGPVLVILIGTPSLRVFVFMVCGGWFFAVLAARLVWPDATDADQPADAPPH